MKRRETKGVYEDGLSGRVPEPQRLSAVSRSPLVRACTRRLTFARGLSRGRGIGTADPLAFIEALYGGKFKAVEGGAFSLDKVYRTTGGGRFVSETRLSLSVHPRFDLRLPGIAGGRAGSHVWHITNSNAAAPSLTVQTWNVLPAVVERVTPSFSYVNVRGPRARQTEGHESARPAARIERRVRKGALTRTSNETSLTTVTRVGLHLTSLNLRQFVTHTSRQEFVSLLHNAYLPAAASRAFLNARRAGGASSASAAGATAQGGVESRFASTTIVAERRPTAWAYAGPSLRLMRGRGVETRSEFRSSETTRERSAAHDPRPVLLHVLPPTSMLLSLSESSLTPAAGAAGQTIYQTGGQVPTPSFQLLRTHTAQTVTRETVRAVDAPRTFARTPQLQATVTRGVLASFNTFVERVHSTVAGVTHADDPTPFTRRGFEATPRRGFGQVPARRHGTSSHAPNQTASFNLFGRSVEFVRPASVAEFVREASTQEAGALPPRESAPGVFSTPGARTFLFATRLLRSTKGTANAEAPSPTAAAALRLVKAAETEHTFRETRAARPEGMALELIRHRREQALQLPQPGYVFTQPARAQLEERQVITKASREEIVEVVRREVRSLTAGINAKPAPSRVELAGLADEVYSTLVRRLMVEKERLGRF